jgi:hypothetical protein
LWIKAVNRPSDVPRDPTLATMAHDLHTYGPKDIRFGARNMDAITIAEDGTPVVADLAKI